VCNNTTRLSMIGITSLFAWTEAMDAERMEAAGEGTALSLIFFVNRYGSSETLQLISAHFSSQSLVTAGSFHLTAAAYLVPSGAGHTRWVEPIAFLSAVVFLAKTS
jgi:hypothetical protein